VKGKKKFLRGTRAKIQEKPVKKKNKLLCENATVKTGYDGEKNNTGGRAE